MSTSGGCGGGASSMADASIAAPRAPVLGIDDPVVAEAVKRNRIVDPRAKLLPLCHLKADPSHDCGAAAGAGGATQSSVGLVLDEEGIMAAHAPPEHDVWEKAAEGGLVDGPVRDPGRIRTWNAAVSANERAERIEEAAALLVDSGLSAACTRLPCAGAASAVTKEALCAAHGAAHVERLLSLRGSSARDTLEFATSSNYVFANDKSVLAALTAAGATLSASRWVLEGGAGETQRSACVVCRPPGHHAEGSCSMGFCLINNVAVAAAAAAHAGETVLIVDWDIHHGNGTQDIFADDPRVLYVSIHMYNNAWEYPMSSPASIVSGSSDYVGEGAGKGFNVNIGWNNGVVPCPAYGDAEYAAAFERVVLPIAKGFDSGAGDECGYGVTPLGYAHMTSALRSIQPRLVVVLEGGYNIPAVARGMHACVAALLDAVDTTSLHLTEAEATEEDRRAALCSATRLGWTSPSPHALTDIEATAAAHRPYWASLAK